MAEKYAFLFPGQGAQAPGMVKDVAESFSSAKKVIDDVSSIVNLDMAKLLWESDAAELQPFLLFFLFHGSTFFLLKARNRAKDSH